MQTQQIKNFFLFSLSVSMFFACCAGGFYLWKNEQIRAEQKALAEKINQEKIAQQKAKRAQLDLYYLNEFRSHFTAINGIGVKGMSKTMFKFVFQRLERIESHMYQDGYSRDEIGLIQNRARCKNI